MDLLGDDVHDAAAAARAELDGTCRQGEEGVVTAPADVVPRMEVGAALALLLWHARASRRVSEMVLLTDAGLSIRHVDHRGRVVRSVLDAYWAKVELDEAAPRAGKLLLKSRGRVLEIGRHLAAPEKTELAEALRGALARARRPDFDNPQLREL